ncbi:hypothetical protein V6N13_032463 [Hibiscus sabdariffa]
MRWVVATWGFMCHGLGYFQRMDVDGYDLGTKHVEHGWGGLVIRGGGPAVISRNEKCNVGTRGKKEVIFKLQYQALRVEFKVMETIME